MKKIETEKYIKIAQGIPTRGADVKIGNENWYIVYSPEQIEYIDELTDVEFFEYNVESARSTETQEEVKGGMEVFGRLRQIPGFDGYDIMNQIADENAEIEDQERINRLDRRHEDDYG